MLANTPSALSGAPAPSAQPRQRIARRALHGVLLLDKPLGLSSNDALQKVKWLLRAEKAGHTGTLDPLASGVLPLCFGAATKFSQLQLDADKTYEAIAQLGQTTTTADAEGEPLLQRPVHLSAEAIEQVRQRFIGRIQQTPPMNSALKKDGRPLYDYAREGLSVEREARSVVVHDLAIEVLGELPSPKALRLRTKVSKGTYIRTLAEDIGEALGCGAHLSLLRRVQTGGFGLADCITLADLQDMSESERIACLRPVDALLHRHTVVTLAPEDAARFLSGLRRRGPWPDADQVAVYGQNPHALLGSAHIRAGELIPGRLLSPIEIQHILKANP
jgi:tRNA pseudouridine55 synthase